MQTSNETGSRQKKDPRSEAPDCIPWRIKAIALDSNASGKAGEPNIDTLAHWADACQEHDAALLLPECVALELAEHVIRESRSFRDETLSHNSRRRRWGQEEVALPTIPTLADVLEALESTGADIVATDAESAQKAIKDQILVQGAGSRRNEVKTGASDGAWTRSLLTWNGGTGNGLVIVSGDKKAMDFLLTLCPDDPPLIVQTLNQLRTLLDRSSEASEQQIAELMTVFDTKNFSPSDLSDRLGLSCPRYWWDSPLAFSKLDGWELQDGIFDFTESPIAIRPSLFDAWTGALTTRLRFTLEIEEQYSEIWSEHANYVTDAFEGWLEMDVVAQAGPSGNWVWTEYDNIELGIGDPPYYS